MEGLGPNTKRPRVMLYPMTLSARWGGKPNEIKTIDAEKNVSSAGCAVGAWCAVVVVCGVWWQR
jgi:hypothetical protein